MIVNVAELKRSGAGVLELPLHLKPEQIENLRLSKPIVGTVRIQNMGTRLQARVELETEIELECVRCMISFPYSIVLEFCEYYSEASFPEREGSLELTGEELEMFAFHGDRLDLGEAIRQNMLLSVPTFPLCKEDCEGLCPGCGTNLNICDCGCSSGTAETES
ncbi:MAG: DUF177 domain-containing protein [Coprothermobacterota bacterium]|nr:DUF177 domain-containing protein [Coprothermobacterota bacterium]